jgi:hypothetical protein
VPSKTEDLARGHFNTTHWSIVLACSGEGGTFQAREALAELFQTYWYPLYAYTRRRGYGEQDAEDLVQAFCLHLQEKHALAKADPQRGKFRTFLLPLVPQARKVRLARLVPKVRRAIRVLLAQQVHKVRLAQLVLKVHRAMLEQQARKAQLDQSQLGQS